MAITSIITIDTAITNTISANIQLNASQQIDFPVYSQSGNSIAFPGSLSSATLSVADFMALLNTYITFNLAIINTYNPSQFITKPFSSITQITYDDGSSQLVSEFMPSSIPLANYTCTYPSGNVVITTRALSRTLSYPQFLYFLYCMANFNLMVRNNYNI